MLTENREEHVVVELVTISHVGLYHKPFDELMATSDIATPLHVVLDLNQRL